MPYRIGQTRKVNMPLPNPAYLGPVGAFLSVRLTARFIEGVQDLSWTKFAYPRNSLYSIRLSA